MGFTATEKILLKHSVDPLESIAPGDFVTAHVDYAGIHEGVDARKFEQFNEFGEMTGVFDPQKIGIYLSHHFCTGHSDELAENQRETRKWAEKLGLPVHDFGSGIAHVIIIEKGFAYPGALCLFGDSHATAYGAVGAMSTQCGLEMIEVFLTGRLWFKVPPTHKYIVEGETRKGVYARDVVQHIVREVGMDASVYAAIEWDGSYIHSLPVPLRFPFTLMAVELGGKCSFIEPDDITLEYLKGRVQHPFDVVRSDPDASFEKTFRFDVSELEPQVCAPSSPDNTKPISEELGAPIDQVCIGTCTGGSIYDFREAAKILEGRKVKARTLIVPATREVFQQCAAEGLIKIFAESGCDLYPAFCGTCQTLSIGHLAPGETQMHPGPRNWMGRTAEGSFAYLASPATCAATALEGKIVDPRKYL
ncbi:MAG: 3-isopropylmalate dehydratase large subunit [Deltaproteobacteria bacterium]|nr:3-isopropylmalate dehydratase large subunit [Deltaproteobacteria bacterium]MBW2129944.1 3-isopropylmalate dehydratase large subunit [Deltaproteobacteria bacterium]